MAFQAFEKALLLVASLRELVGKLDADLAGQLRRAAASVPLNLSEGNRRVGKDRLHFFRIAAGSADEVIACLRVAEAWRQLTPDEIRVACGYADQVLAMVWTLTH